MKTLLCSKVAMCAFPLLLIVGFMRTTKGDAEFQAADSKTEQKKFAGVWELIVIEKNGVKALAADGQAKWMFEDDKYTTRFGGQVQEGTFTIQPGKDPKTIDLVVTSGPPSKGHVYRGIYKFFDDELIFCISDDGRSDRPIEFTAKVGSQQTLNVLRRKKE